MFKRIFEKHFNVFGDFAKTADDLLNICFSRICCLSSCSPAFVRLNVSFCLSPFHKVFNFLNMRLHQMNNALQLPVFFSFFSFFCRPYPKYRAIWSKKYFTDHQTANTIQLFIPIKK